MKTWVKVIGWLAALCTLAACQPHHPVSDAEASAMAAVGTENIVLSKQSGIAIRADEDESSQQGAEISETAVRVPSSGDKRK